MAQPAQHPAGTAVDPDDLRTTILGAQICALEANLPDGLRVYSFPESHRRLIRTTHGLERLNQEVRRRTRVARLFPNEASCLRLVSAVLMEISEEWETGKVYLSLTDD